MLSLWEVRNMELFCYRILVVKWTLPSLRSRRKSLFAFWDAINMFPWIYLQGIILYFSFWVTRLITAVSPSLVLLISLELKRRLNNITWLFLAIGVAGLCCRKELLPFPHSCIYWLEKESQSSRVTSPSSLAHSSCKERRSDSVIWFVSGMTLTIFSAVCSHLDWQCYKGDVILSICETPLWCLRTLHKSWAGTLSPLLTTS